MSVITEQPETVSRGIRRWVLAAGGFVAGMFMVFACSPSSKPPGRIARKLVWEFRRLRHLIVGRNREAVRCVLGSPKTAALSVPDKMQSEVRIENAETWYYPLGPERALAIRFVKNTARRVEFLSTPH